VAPACHPSYSGGRDQEDRGLKPAQANDKIIKINKRELKLIAQLYTLMDRKVIKIRDK
jgi:hypothetical protein